MMRKSLDANEQYFADQMLYDSLNSLNKHMTFHQPESLYTGHRISHQQIRQFYDQPSEAAGLQEELYRQIEQQQDLFKIHYDPSHQRQHRGSISSINDYEYSQIIERKDTSVNSQSNVQQYDISPQRITVKPQRKDILPPSSKRMVKQQQVVQHNNQDSKLVIRRTESMVEKENSSPMNMPHQLSYSNIQIEQETKQILITWLLNINLIKKQIQSTAQLIEKLPKLAKSGVFFCDLINRINGKIQEPLKGINRKPNHRQYGHNWYKVFEFLRRTERMLPRYLYCEYIYTSNSSLYENAFWCLLGDAHAVFSQKPTRSDSLTKRISSQHQSFVSLQIPSAGDQVKLNAVNQSSFLDHSRTDMPSKNSRSNTKQQTESIQEVRRSQQQPLISNLSQYSTIYNSNSQLKSQIDTKSQFKIPQSRDVHNSKSPIEALVKVVPPPKTNNNLINIGNVIMLKISQSLERELQQWLQMMMSLDKIVQGGNLFDDPYRNGLLICRLLVKLGLLRSSNNITHKPKNISECQENWIESLCVFSFVDQQYRKIILEKLLQGCKNTFYSLLSQIKNFYNDWVEAGQAEAIKLAIKNELEVKTERIIPKKAEKTKIIQKSLIKKTNIR